MMMLTKEIRTQLLANGAANMARFETEDGDTQDFKPVVKFFNPIGAATWLFTELDENEDTLFGLCDLGFGCPELGNASLSEIEAIIIQPFGLKIERDMYWTAGKTLSEYATIAREKGRIVA